MVASSAVHQLSFTFWNVYLHRACYRYTSQNAIVRTSPGTSSGSGNQRQNNNSQATKKQKTNTAPSRVSTFCPDYLAGKCPEPCRHALPHPPCPNCQGQHGRIVCPQPQGQKSSARRQLPTPPAVPGGSWKRPNDDSSKRKGSGKRKKGKNN